MKNKSFHSFQEYLTHKGKVLTKPPVEDTPDYKGPKPKSPAKAATKGKGWEVPSVGKKGTPGAYKSGTDKAQKKAEKGGFGDMGDKALVYKPAEEIHGGKGSVSKSEQGVPGGKKAKTWPKTGSTTESFLADTKGMSTAQFAKHVKKGLNEHCGCEDKKAPHVVAYSVGAFHPDPIQAIRYVTYLANENGNLRHALVREAARAGCGGSLLHDLLQLPEAFKTLAQIIDSDKGEAFNRRLEKAIRENRDELRKRLHEEVDEPAHDDNVDVNDLDKTELDDDDSDGPDDGEDDLDLDDDGGDDNQDGDLDLGGDDEHDLDLDDDGGKGGDDLDLGDDKGGGDLGDDPHADAPPPSPEEGGDDLGGDDDGPPPPPPDEAGGDDDGKIDFGDDDDDDLGGDDDDLGGDDDDLGGDDDDDDDDLGDDDDHPKKKMPWDED